MYYDLVSSLPYLPYFRRADRLPITPLRLERRLSLLKPSHATQLNQVRPIVALGIDQLKAHTDEALVKNLSKCTDVPLDKELREYLLFRVKQRWLIAALRCRQGGLRLPDTLASANVGLNTRRVQQYWEAPGLGLEALHRWLPDAANCLSNHDLLGLERLLIELNWAWLTRRADQDMFRFAAVFAYVFKWDMLRAWLQNDPIAAKLKFTELVNKVTDDQHN
ncbi:DUF2764 family protein [Bremerella sp. JC770]|uniref:DUF2764 family protein n=1 Tax=Bremerella sp. JC770 TaxID=3232137 RepID=UPI00345959A5